MQTFVHPLAFSGHTAAMKMRRFFGSQESGQSKKKEKEQKKTVFLIKTVFQKKQRYTAKHLHIVHGSWSPWTSRNPYNPSIAVLEIHGVQRVQGILRSHGAKEIQEGWLIHGPWLIIYLWTIHCPWLIERMETIEIVRLAGPTPLTTFLPTCSVGSLVVGLCPWTTSLTQHALPEQRLLILLHGHTLSQHALSEQCVAFYSWAMSTSELPLRILEIHATKTRKELKDGAGRMSNII